MSKSDELHFITSRTELNEERLGALDRDKERLRQELASIDEKLSRESANAEAAQSSSAAVKEEMDAAGALASEKHDAVKALEEKLAKSEETKLSYNRMVARAHLLEELERSYEGYNGSVRFIMSRKLPGIIGVLGELLIVPKGCELAVDYEIGRASCRERV